MLPQFQPVIIVIVFLLYNYITSDESNLHSKKLYVKIENVKKLLVSFYTYCFIFNNIFLLNITFDIASSHNFRFEALILSSDDTSLQCFSKFFATFLT